MHQINVGELYAENRTSWPEVTEYNFDANGHELRIFMSHLTAEEIESARFGDVHLGLFIRHGVMFLLYRIQGVVKGWSDAPYSWHLVPADRRATPDRPTPAQKALFQIVLIDADTGIVKAIRGVTASPHLTQILYKEIADQIGKPFDEAEYANAIARVYQQYPDPSDMLKHAIATCLGGE